MKILKRALDFVLALVGLAVLSPVLILSALGIWFTMGTPIFYCQTRPGFHGRPFKMYKFRTMTEKNDGKGRLLPDADRLTSLGEFLRSSSLDELPELLNVLKGDMSLVGPRPLLMEYFPLYTKEQARRQEVKPGITGWAQVNGRNAISWEEKFKLDVWYVDHQSFWHDIKILWLTLIKVFKREGINQEGQTTMEKFKGTRNNHE